MDGTVIRVENDALAQQCATAVHCAI